MSCGVWIRGGGIVASVPKDRLSLKIYAERQKIKFLLEKIHVRFVLYGLLLCSALCLKFDHGMMSKQIPTATIKFALGVVSRLCFN